VVLAKQNVFLHLAIKWYILVIVLYLSAHWNFKIFIVVSTKQNIIFTTYVSENITTYESENIMTLASENSFTYKSENMTCASENILTYASEHMNDLGHVKFIVGFP
jgi:hypothetical protein